MTHSTADDGRSPPSAGTNDPRSPEQSEDSDLARLIEELSLDAIYRFDPQGVITFASRSAAEQLGVPADELVGRHFAEFFSAEAFPGARAVFERAASGEKVGLIAVTATRPDGSEVPVEVAATPILRNGRVHGVLGVSRDVSARKRAEAGLDLYRRRLEQLLDERSEELRRAYERFDRHLIDRERIEESLRENEAFYRSIADGAPVMMWACDPVGLCTYFNQAWLDFRGRVLEQELGRGWVEGVAPETLSRLEVIFGDALLRRARFTAEYQLRRADGTLRWVEVVGSPRFDAAGAFLGYVGWAVDVTDRRDRL